jgi:hypothetical protein
VVIDHCEEPTLAELASMNEGPVSTKLGLRGAPAAGEAIMVERDVLLAELTGGRVHIAHLSAAASVDAVRRGKARGVLVTAEVTPHHLFLTDAAVSEAAYDTNTKMNPPLRSEADRRAVLEGCATGRSTASPPTTLRTPATTRTSSTTRPPSGSSGSRPRCRSASTGWWEPTSSRCRSSSHSCRRGRRACWAARRDALPRLARGPDAPRPRQAPRGRPRPLRAAAGTRRSRAGRCAAGPR